MGLSTPIQERRKSAIEKVNETEADIEIAAARLADAERKKAEVEAMFEKSMNAVKSEIGTATKELARTHGRYQEARARMLALVPAEGPAIEKLETKAVIDQRAAPPPAEAE